MVERVCPECQHGNLLDNRFCGRCGAALERQLPLHITGPSSTQTTAITIAGRALPVTWRQVGQTMAVGLTALVAEAGMAWLRRKIEHVALPQAPTSAPPTTALVPGRTITPSAPTEVVTIISQRVVEVWEQGKLTRQVVERHLWRKES